LTFQNIWNLDALQGTIWYKQEKVFMEASK